MKKIELFCILFALYVYNNYIVEDWSIYKKIGIIYYYPFWLIRSIIIWLICPLFIPEYFFKQSKMYRQIKKIMDSPELQKQMLMLKT